MEIFTTTNNPPKSANQLYNESGTDLSFVQWIEQEKLKATTFIKNKKLTELVDIKKEQLGLTSKPTLKTNNIFGLSKNVIIFSSIIIISAISIKIYQNSK